MRRCPLVLFLILYFACFAAGQTSCASYSTQDVPLFWDPYGTQDHVTGGYHQFYSTLTGSCVYASVGMPNCSSVSTSYGSISNQDTGRLTTVNPLYQHNVGNSVNGGTNQAPLGGVATTSQATGAATVTSCLLSCGAVISFSGGTGTGVNVSVSFPPDSIFGLAQAISTSCPNEPDPSYGQGGGSGFGGTGCCGGGETCGLFSRRGGAQGEAGGGTICDPSTCGCEPASPIIIDTTGHGFHLTSPQDGVSFDILNTGIPVKIAWTSATSGNAFLALDRNHNGRIDDGGELFGDHTQQPPSANPNGYLALAEFDKPENGGNGDGIIDYRDAVFPKLLLWIDENHDGISQPNELHTLPELGVYSIALHYQEEPYTDDWGNWFHYRAAINPSPVDGQSKDGRWTYDVFFMPEKTSLPAKAAAFKLTEPPLFK